MNTSTKILMWLNTVAAMLSITPNVMEGLKGSLPEHYYGWLSAVVALANVGIATFIGQLQKHEKLEKE